MGKADAVNLDPLFDRPWRPGQRVGRRAGGSRLRRWGMTALLLVLCGVISAYGYVTDSDRVRQMAESYLTGLTGGRVTVGRATLSIFEGLRLDNIRLFVEPAAPPHGEPEPPGSLLFQAQSFVLRYNPKTLFTGRLEATQILVQKPEVLLAEDVERGEWNYSRLLNRRRRTPRTGTNAGPAMLLPEVLLRNARVIVSQIKGGREQRIGAMAIDGRLAPSDEGDRFTFNLQSRGDWDGLGPMASGAVGTGSGRVTARLLNFKFGQDLLSMVPFADPREWWQRHELAGAIDIPEISYTPPRDGNPPNFRIVSDLRGVTLTVHPEEWMGRADLQRMHDRREAIGVVRRLYAVAGFRVAPDAKRDQRPLVQTKPTAPTGRPSDWVTGTSSRRPPAAASVIPLDRLAALLEPPSVTLQGVSGRLVFTPERIDVQYLTGRVEGNGFKIGGRINGYRPDATANLELATPDGENLYVPPSPRYVASLPREARELYEQFHPQGDCRLWVRVDRDEPGARPQITGRVDVVSGQFVFSKFPYPLRDVTGRIEFGREPASGMEQLTVHVRGHGPADGPNRDTVLTIDSFGTHIAPLATNECGVFVRIAAQGAHSDELLLAAFPPEVRRALKVFDAPGKGDYPKLYGDFVCNVVRPMGRYQHWTFDTDLTLADAAGSLVFLPYPLKGITGVVKVRDGYALIENAFARRGDATLRVDGRVAWGHGEDSGFRAQGSGEESETPGALAALSPLPPGEGRGEGERKEASASPNAFRTGLVQAIADAAVLPPADDFARDRRTSTFALTPALSRGERGESPEATGNPPLRTDLKVTIRNLPIDNDLIAALPEDRRAWLTEMGLSGRLDIDGRVFDEPTADVEPSAAAAAAPTDDPFAGRRFDYDLSLALRGGTVWPHDGTFAITDLAGRLRLDPRRLDVLEMTGRRGAARLAGGGAVDWSVPGTRPTLRLDMTAAGLALDPPLYALLPPAATKAWDEVQPEGTIDAELHYNGPLGGATAALTARNAPTRATPTIPSQSQAVAGASSPVPPGFTATLKPRKLSATVRTVPYKLENVQGTIRVWPDRVQLEDVTAEHRGGAKLRLAGTGTLAGPQPAWNLQLSGKGLPVDDDLRRALPPTLTGLAESIKLKGAVDFDLTKFHYREVGATLVSPSADSANGRRARQVSPLPGNLNPSAEIDLAGSVTFAKAAMDVGVAMEQVQGAVEFTSAVRNGRLARLNGELHFPSLTLAGRPVRNFYTELVKPEDLSELRLGKISGEIAGGTMGGFVNISYPDRGASRYSLSLVVRDADVKQLAWEPEEKGRNVEGRLTASLALEGNWDDASKRRGRGDVMLAGREMYRIPLVLGLLQVTNLALPISGPFNEATARYSVDGQKVTFENIEFRSDQMTMTGDGSLDFANKTVSLVFSTDNPNGLRLPFLHELWQGARNEMLKIYVRGTIQEPKVSAQSMGTVWTTVDEVFKGDNPQAKQNAGQRKGRK